mmetsp:Transcript_11874/g.15475  ORF Transcript_11874/g.15475 Transcript_11874/m.15475 type:complete len:216 (+) Transcript_11874:452-1099(+)
MIISAMLTFELTKASHQSGNPYGSTWLASTFCCPDNGFLIFELIFWSRRFSKIFALSIPVVKLCPQNISNKTIPKLKISEENENSFLSFVSGDKYKYVPATVFSELTLNVFTDFGELELGLSSPIVPPMAPPRSPILILSPPTTKMFWGFKSRWITLTLCRYANPLAICTESFSKDSFNASALFTYVLRRISNRSLSVSSQYSIWINKYKGSFGF